MESALKIGEKMEHTPRLVGHLIRFPVSAKGGFCLVDPDEITSVTAHRTDEGTTVVRQRNTNYVLFIPLPLESVSAWIADALEAA